MSLSRADITMTAVSTAAGRKKIIVESRAANTKTPGGERKRSNMEAKKCCIREWDCKYRPKSKGRSNFQIRTFEIGQAVIRARTLHESTARRAERLFDGQRSIDSAQMSPGQSSEC